MLSDTGLKMAVDAVLAAFSVEVVDAVESIYGLDAYVYVFVAKAPVATVEVVDVAVALFAVVLMAVEADAVTELAAVKSDQEYLVLEMHDHLVLEMHDRPVLEMNDRLVFETPYSLVLGTPVYGQHSPTAD